jgi:hypothetical protein
VLRTWVFAASFSRGFKQRAALIDYRLSPNDARAPGSAAIFIRNLAIVFDPYLERQQLAAKPLFSKTL